MKTFAVLGAVSVIGLSILAPTPVYAGSKRCTISDDGVRHCLTKRQARRQARKGTSPTEVPSAGSGGVGTASANGGAVSIGDVNSGGNAGNAIGVGDTYGGAVPVD